MQNVEREIYMNDICSFEKSERMQKYYRDKFSGMVKFEDGSYIVFEKPRIKTDFCFGYGMYLRSTDEEQERANNMSHTAETSETYFREKQLEELINLKEAVNDNSYDMYIHCHYCNEPDECNLKGYSFVKIWDEPYSNLRAIRKLTKAERELVSAGIDNEIEKFNKRITTYLKKYGLSKVNSWTYLVD